MKSENLNFNRDFFIAVYGDDEIPVIFTSDNFKISEFDILRLIRICYKEGRNKKIGESLLSIYKEVIDDSVIKLKKIGIDENGIDKTRKYKRR